MLLNLLLIFEEWFRVASKENVFFLVDLHFFPINEISQRFFYCSRKRGTSEKSLYIKNGAWMSHRRFFFSD
uniref:Uncharacterized protein n=1 Tax=Oryza brachyantha TaxID=4533 RepID=J3N892_ORYBR